MLEDVTTLEAQAERRDVVRSEAGERVIDEARQPLLLEPIDVLARVPCRRRLASAGVELLRIGNQSRSLVSSPSDRDEPVGAPDSMDFHRGRPHSRRVTRPSEVAHSFVAAISRHDPDAAARCFAEDYEDEAPARRGEEVRGRDEARANFVRLFASIPDIRATIIRQAERKNEVWMEWRLAGTRDDGTLMEFVGVNIFGVEDDTFRWGRIYTELARDAGGIEAQLERMTGGDAPAG